MPARRLTRCGQFALVLATLSLLSQQACTSFRPIRPETAIAGQVVRVHYPAPLQLSAPVANRDSAHVLAWGVQGRFASVSGDSVTITPSKFLFGGSGVTDRYLPARFELRDHGVLEAEHFDGKKTAILVGGIVIVLGALAAYAASNIAYDFGKVGGGY